MRLSALFLSASPICAVAFAVPAVAQQASAPAADDQADGHTQPSIQIVVSAPFERKRDDVASAVTVLQGDDLQLQQRSTIGETLARQPGVSSTFFGPNASRPILRGLDSERVRVLTDGIGSFDVSNTSVDHAVAINPHVPAKTIRELIAASKTQKGGLSFGS